MTALRETTTALLVGAVVAGLAVALCQRLAWTPWPAVALFAVYAVAVVARATRRPS